MAASVTGIHASVWMNATDSGVPWPPRIATSSALCPPSTKPARTHAAHNAEDDAPVHSLKKPKVCVYLRITARESESGDSVPTASGARSVSSPSLYTSQRSVPSAKA